MNTSGDHGEPPSVDLTGFLSALTKEQTPPPPPPPQPQPTLQYLPQLATFSNEPDLRCNEGPVDAPDLSMSLSLTPPKDANVTDVLPDDTKDDGVTMQSPFRPRAMQQQRPEQRVARPPPPTTDMRARNQLLPRYWPRITDQEIQQVTSDSNSVLTPLFEKILSASDAGRIGRLVLPKACAEAYFPPISQPEGLPLRIKDMDGREWQFQFRFWPNNNSRMYVLEGVTPCIQAMRLVAGDTVTFSRLEPENKLVMGYRRASVTTSTHTGQEDEGTAMKDSTAAKEPNKVVLYDPKKLKDSSSQAAIAIAATDKRKGSRPLGSKSKRLRLDTEDSMAIKSSWEDAQDLLRPPPGIAPTLVTIDGHEFEEYEEPPVLAKKTITRTKANGEKDRFVQCDACTQFRKVPLYAFLHTQWTCSDNTWDPKKAHCSAPRDLTNSEVDQLLGNKPPGHGKVAARPGENGDALDALASAAIGEPTSPPPVTTKHPRHRPGCTCIVCIQPPSGKGPKHKPNCQCNVCLTVKRRFKTLMLRRKKRQVEREAENAARKKKPGSGNGTPNGTPGGTPNGSPWDGHGHVKEESTPMPMVTPPPGSTVVPPSTDGVKWNGLPTTFMTERGKAFPFSGLLPFSMPHVLGASGEEGGLSLGNAHHHQQQHAQHFDLNNHPDRDDHQKSMMKLLHDASLPLESYLRQQGMSSMTAMHLHHLNLNNHHNNTQEQLHRQQQQQYALQQMQLLAAAKKMEEQAQFHHYHHQGNVASGIVVSAAAATSTDASLRMEL